MALTSPRTIKSLLREHNLHPNKRLGQNFLVSKKVLREFVDAAEIGPEDTVVEAGAGLGTLTLELAKRARRVIAIEKDRKLIPILQKVTIDCKNTTILNLDILEFGNWDLEIDWKLEIAAPFRSLWRRRGNWKLAGNIPYYLTSHLIRTFLEAECPPQSMVLIVQKEVAQRICAKPPEMSMLSVSVQFYAEAKIVSYVPRSAFWPQPDVDSAIIKLKIRNQKSKIRSGVAKDVAFFKIVKIGFSAPRKQLANNLAKGLGLTREQAEKWLKEADIEPARRAETLGVEEWKRLIKNSELLVVDFRHYPK